MAKANKNEVKEKNIGSLKEDLKAKREDLFKARMDHTRGKLKNTKSLTTMRKDIARILTMIKMHEFAQAKSVAQVQDKKEVANG